jgi:hypothetical protein
MTDWTSPTESRLAGTLPAEFRGIYLALANARTGRPRCRSMESTECLRRMSKGCLSLRLAV